MVESQEGEVAGLRGLVEEGVQHGEEAGVEFGVGRGGEEGDEGLGGGYGGDEEGRVEIGEGGETLFHQPEMHVRSQREGGQGLRLLDLRGDERAAADHGDEIRHAVAHVGGLEGEGVAGGEEGIRFAVAAVGFGERVVEPFDGLAASDDRHGAVVALWGHAGQVGGA